MQVTFPQKAVSMPTALFDSVKRKIRHKTAFNYLNSTAQTACWKHPVWGKKCQHEILINIQRVGGFAQGAAPRPPTAWLGCKILLQFSVLLLGETPIAVSFLSQILWFHPPVPSPIAPELRTSVPSEAATQLRRTEV